MHALRFGSIVFFTLLFHLPLLRAETSADLLDALGGKVGLVAVIDWSEADEVLDLLKENEITIYFQSANAEVARTMRRKAAAAGLLGTRIFVDVGPAKSIQLANNLADAILVGPGAQAEEAELLRVLRPKGVAFMGAKKIAKPVPAGIDEWTHPYHGPDNNPQSRDQLARGEFRTQFINHPKFSPMPEQTVAGGGRIYKAMGHIAHRSNQNPHLNTLLCINAYNGLILWKRPLPEGFMIHRNTMIAADDALYLGDHESCKIIDAKTGEVRSEFTVPDDLTDGPVWKWMARRDGMLYALVGHDEIEIETKPSANRGLGHWPWGMWKGHDYQDPANAFGFGRTLVAMDEKTGAIKWHLRSEDYLDARAVTMNSSQIFVYSPDRKLMAVDYQTGKVAWTQEGDDVLEAIGPNQRAQLWVTGYATSSYMKCNDDYLFFAGPQRKQMSVLSAKDGSLAWTHPDGNLQLVLRDEAIYAAGPKSTGVLLDYKTGKAIGQLPTRRACTRATGTIDSVFYRARGGTIRVLTGGDEPEAHHIAAMRPPCQDGVLVSNGHLYWGPWMCGCELSLYGNIGLGPAGNTTVPEDESLYRDARLSFDAVKLKPLGLKPNDWPAYRAGNDRSDFVKRPLPEAVAPSWTAKLDSGLMPTAPVAGGGMVFVADRSGAVQAFGADGKKRWKRFTAGPVYFPPALAGDRVFVGSADGRVYAFAAKTGEPLWSFRVGPPVERIHVFGELISRWPVAGGVVVQDNTVYAAAGIANYDGTYVVALDVATGQRQAHNSTSGKLAPKVNGGISLQGNLFIADNELQFTGGGVYQTARYDLKTLVCLNEGRDELKSTFQTAFYPYYPAYGKFVSLQATCSDGVLCHAASYEGNAFGDLALYPPSKEGVATGEAARRYLRRRPGARPGSELWKDAQRRRYTGFVMSDDLLIATGHTEAAPDKPFLAAVRIKDGVTAWKQDLPADAVKGGIAIDHADRLFVSLEDGRLMGFEPTQAAAETTAKPNPAPPEKTRITFLADRSMKPYPRGTRKMKFPEQQTDDPLGPLEGKGIYFQQRDGKDRDLYYQIETTDPVRKIHYRGAATFEMTMHILNLDGSVAYRAGGPFKKGNVYSEHTVEVPAHVGPRFILRFHNRAGEWFYIETLRFE